MPRGHAASARAGSRWRPPPLSPWPGSHAPFAAGSDAVAPRRSLLARAIATSKLGFPRSIRASQGPSGIERRPRRQPRHRADDQQPSDSGCPDPDIREPLLAARGVWRGTRPSQGEEDQQTSMVDGYRRTSPGRGKTAPNPGRRPRPPARSSARRPAWSAAGRAVSPGRQRLDPAGPLIDAGALLGDLRQRSRHRQRTSNGRSLSEDLNRPEDLLDALRCGRCPAGRCARTRRASHVSRVPAGERCTRRSSVTEQYRPRLLVGCLRPRSASEPHLSR